MRRPPALVRVLLLTASAALALCVVLSGVAPLPVLPQPARVVVAETPERPSGTVASVAAPPPTAPHPTGAPTSWSGTTVASLLPNYNGSLAGNFRSLLADWQVGAPAVVPSTGTVWWPEVPVSVGGSPKPASAPALLYNLSRDAFVGLDVSVTNISAFAYDPVTRTLYGTDPINDTVQSIDPLTGVPNGTPYHVGSDPSAIAYDTTTGYLFVANAGSNSVTVIDPVTRAVPWASVAVGNDPIALADDGPDGWMYVANGGSAYLSRLDVSSPPTSELPTGLQYGAAQGLAYSSKSDYLAVTSKNGTNLTIVIGSSGDVHSATVFVGSGFDGVTTAGSGSTFLVANSSSDEVKLVNASTFAVSSKTLTVGLQPSPLISESYAGPVLVWNNGSRNVSVIAANLLSASNPGTTLGPEPTLLAYAAPLHRLFVGDSALPGVEVLNPFTGASEQSPIPLPSPPLALTLDPNGTVLYVALSSEVVALNASTGLTSAQNDLLAGTNGPIALDPASQLLWVGRQGSNEVVALDATSLVASGPVVHVRTNASAPDGLIYASGSGSMFTVNASGGQVVQFNGSTGALIGGPGSAGTNATALVWDPVDGYVYAAGDDLSVIDPSNMSFKLDLLPLAPHVHVGGIAYEPSREAIYVGTWTGSPFSGSLSVVNASSLSASTSGITVVPTGFEPSSLAVVEGGAGSLPDSGTVLVSNEGSGTISVLASPPQILSAAFSPSEVDEGVPTELSVAATGGATNSTLSFPDGLPPGCAAPGGLTVRCVPTESGSFVVEVDVVDALGEVATASAVLHVAATFTLSAEIGRLPSHEADLDVAVPMVASASGGVPNYTYSWAFGDGTHGSGAYVNHTYGKTGAFVVEVTATDQGGGRVVNSTLVVVEPDPSVQLSASPGTTTDVNLTLDLNATMLGGAGPGSWKWSFGDGTTSSEALTAHAWAKPGLYAATFNYTDALNLTALQHLDILVNPLLTGTFRVLSAAASPIVGTSYTFNSTVANGTPPYSVVWSFGDGTSEPGVQVTHAYAAPGTYDVVVEVTDAAGGSLSERLPSVHVGAGPAGAAPLFGGGFGPSFALGLVIGGTLAAVALFLAERARRSGPAGPPSPYVPPSGTGRGRP